MQHLGALTTLDVCKVEMKLVFVFSLIVATCSSKELPSYIKKCKLSDPNLKVGDCIVNRIGDLQPRLLDGIPEMKLPPIEPFRFPKFELNTGSNERIQINAVVTDLELRGMKDIIIDKLDLNLEEKTLVLKLKVPVVNTVGNYDIKGKVLMFEVKTQGKFSANLTNVQALTKSRFTIVDRDGKRYIQFKRNADDEAENSIDSAKIRFDNLFDNNEINDRVNAAINENVMALSKEFGPFVHTSIHKVISGILAPVFKEYSVEELFDP
ncbi:hypothetical protein PPYR_14137 [Photinus pyralis]|uniref:Uncharacterized protein n=1 Tax=Photinus pyralis TaxID=7054 RepID=A0A5N4A4F7_PHOPY|nr:hypothetical protein PPYR_14137 [Photinus pyralis]